MTGCECNQNARGLCKAHYIRWWRGTPSDKPIRQLGQDKPVCRVLCCERPSTARGLCKAHWQRWKKGRPLGGTIFEPKSLKEYLQHYALRMQGHLIWCGTLDPAGYGQLGKKHGRAHRAAWKLAYGPIPRGVFILHRCNIPPCVEPTHLYSGTHTDNMRDAVRAGNNYNINKTLCPQGHPYDEENTYTAPNGGRHCRTCNRESQERYLQRGSA